MRTILELSFAIPVIYLMGVWAWRQIISLRTSIALRPGRAIVLEFCTSIIEDQAEGHNVRRYASWLARLSLNEPLLQSFAESLASGMVVEDRKQQKTMATNPGNQKYLDASLHLLAYMTLCYHPKHGSVYRKLLRQ